MLEEEVDQEADEEGEGEVDEFGAEEGAFAFSEEREGGVAILTDAAGE